MKKQLKEWGNSLVITFSPEEQRIYGLKEGDIIDLDDFLVDNGGKKKHDTK